MSNNKDIQELRTMLAELARSTTHDGMDEYYAVFSQSAKVLSQQHNPTIQAELVFIFIDLMKMAHEHYGDEHFPDYVLNGCPELFTVEGTLLEVLKAEAHTDYLAFMCLDVAYYLTENGYRPEVVLNRMLRILSGVEVAEDSVTTLSTATGLLYGSHVYDLYRPDVVKEGDFPAYLKSLKLPLRINSSFAVPMNMTVSLPNDVLPGS